MPSRLRPQELDLLAEADAQRVVRDVAERDGTLADVAREAEDNLHADVSERVGKAEHRAHIRDALVVAPRGARSGGRAAVRPPARIPKPGVWQPSCRTCERG